MIRNTYCHCCRIFWRSLCFLVWKIFYLIPLLKKKSPNYHLYLYFLTEMRKFYSSSFHMNLRAHSCFCFLLNPISTRVNICMVYEKGTFKLAHISCLAACAMTEHMSAHLCWLLTWPF